MEEKHKRNTRPTDATVRLREKIVYEMLVKGLQRPAILQYSAENWRLSERQTDEYIAKANAEIEKNFGESYRKRLMTSQLAKLNDLYIKNYTNEDFRECRGVIETLNKMTGLNEPERHEVAIDTPEIVINVKRRDKGD